MTRFLIAHESNCTLFYLEFNPLLILSRHCNMKLHFVSALVGQHFSLDCDIHAATEHHGTYQVETLTSGKRARWSVPGESEE